MVEVVLKNKLNRIKKGVDIVVGTPGKNDGILRRRKVLQLDEFLMWF